MGTDGTDDKVVELHGRGWHTAEALADREGVSVRTIYRRLERGEVEKRQTEDGARYRLADGGTDTTDSSGVSTDSHDTDTDTSADTAPQGEGTDTTDSSGVSADVTTDRPGVSELVDLVREQGDRIADLERKVGELEERNEWLRAELEAVRDGGDDGDQADGSEDRDDDRPRATDGLHPLVAELKRTAEE